MFVEYKGDKSLVFWSDLYGIVVVGIGWIVRVFFSLKVYIIVD